MENDMKEFGKVLKLPVIGELDLKKNHGIFIKIGIISETTGFFINRNNESTELTSENFLDEERLVVPASKWRGAERSYLLSELRKLDGVIPGDYSRNMVERKGLLKNPASLVYGDSSTGKTAEAAGIASRVFYDWAYSYEPLSDITIRLLHNSLSDSGAILQEDAGKVKSNAIYNTPYVKPGVKLIRFISLENVSVEMFTLVVMAIIGTTRYGARTAILGDNMSNRIVGIGFSKMETPVSSYTVMKKAWESKKYEPEMDILSAMKNSYGQNLLEGEKLEDVIKKILKMRSDTQLLSNICRLITTKMENDWSDFWGKTGKKGEDLESNQTNFTDIEGKE
ncbi:type I-D CRISPR-associated protein Cas7/Csc2 [Cuniculiplasma sp. SKW3]|uniref:type I-D CRISPR-associated protein Cas7/Csc2 n=1 Tax=Cuniculiplasma sp. SKW3 TaxID=3400170 RepID=UPI003FD387FD